LDDAPVVVLAGLSRSPELNGCLGIICGFDAGSGRYHVRLLTEERMLALTPDKLQPLRTFWLDGIRSRPEVNGCLATAVRFLPESGRVEVNVEGFDANLSVWPDHIRLDVLSAESQSEQESDASTADSTPLPEHAAPLHRSVTPRDHVSRESSRASEPLMSLDAALAVLEKAGRNGTVEEDVAKDLQECELLSSRKAITGEPNHHLLYPCNGILKSDSASSGRRATFAFDAEDEMLYDAAITVEAFLFDATLCNEQAPNAAKLRSTPGALYAVASALKFASTTWESVPHDGVSEDSIGSIGELGETIGLQRMPIAEIELLLRVRLLTVAARGMRDSE